MKGLPQAPKSKGFGAGQKVLHAFAHIDRKGGSMFIGHYAVALVAKKAAPRVSLGTMILAAQFPDLLWPPFLLLDLEHVRIAPGNTAFTPLDFYDYPISHGLIPSLFWACLLGLLFFLVRSSVRGTLIVAAGVFSHWVLDFFTHRPDLPLAPGSGIFFGLGLWNSVPWSIIVEGGMFIVGIVLYLRTTGPLDRAGNYGLWAFLILLGGIYAANILSPPPPNATAVAIAGLGLWLFVPWGYWIDHHRRVNIP